MSASARACALDVLTACRTRRAWADATLKEALSENGLPPEDAALCSRLVYGVLQNRMGLDARLSACCKQRLSHLQHPLPDILRLGAYQILFLDRVPDHAAVSEAVALAHASGRGAAAGLVNAVLRRLAREKDRPPALPDDPAARLSIETSHPRWLTERMIALLGREEAARFLRANNEIVPLGVQRNPLRTTREALLEELRAAGIPAEPHAWAPDCLTLRHTGDVTALPAFSEGRFTVQDAAARLVTMAAGIEPGQRVLDVCAAPGGKSFSAGFAMRNRGELLSCDVHEGKLREVRAGAARLGLTCLRAEAADARVFHPAWEGAFDVVLCDVPCSGLGVIRKKPDIRYRDPGALAALPALQRAILDNSARYVRPGGVLLYSTCTVLPEENEAVTDAFLRGNPAYRPAPFTLPPPVGETAGRVTLWPHRHGTDAFYICRMRRGEHD